MINNDSTIFSIGHGNRSFEDFFDILNSYNIEFLIDVRSNPRSRFYPHFNRKNLETNSSSFGIRYLFLGDTLGGKPKDRSCYDAEGHVDYDLVMEKEFFKDSANRLLVANAKKIRVACMCSETKPCECHRSKMIGEYLKKYDIEMQHIDKEGRLISQTKVISEIIGDNENLFPDDISFKSRGKY
ncbi:DUF488 family protein [Moraxella atlantae]|uniref:DUF488 domain-containing protein n=1 Tax=Faucicola atlantae TaxID=34059 RepID=UPI003751BAC1